MRRTTKVCTGLALSFFCVAANAAVPKKLGFFPEGERLVYSRFVEHFRKNEVSKAIQQRRLLEKKYPSSVHLDNAFYMTGMLHFQNENFAQALSDFGTVTERFPRSNKRPSALFAKAVTYEKLSLPNQAARVYQMVIDEYPGSQESQRAWMHLRIRKKAQKN
ncbi:MAG: tol-pal system YbgF family protein [Bdellovibrionales bacterium]